MEENVDTTKPINIIVVMNESFSDLTIFDNLRSLRTHPFLHSLSENTIKGWMYYPRHPEEVLPAWSLNTSPGSPLSSSLPTQ